MDPWTTAAFSDYRDSVSKLSVSFLPQRLVVKLKLGDQYRGKVPILTVMAISVTLGKLLCPLGCHILLAKVKI
jgi:hypothetical protein